MKKYIFTEEQIKTTKNVLEESNNKYKMTYCIQKLLNEIYPKLNLELDANMGPRTSEAFKIYQKSLGVNPDGLMGDITMGKMKPEHKKTIDNCYRQPGSTFGTGNWMGDMASAGLDKIANLF